MTATSWEAIAALGALVVLAKVVMLALAIRGTKPSERPAIIRALAELTRSWPSRPGQQEITEPPPASPPVTKDPPG